MNEQTTKSRTRASRTRRKSRSRSCSCSAGIAGYYLLAAQPRWLRWLAVVAGLVLGVVVFASLAATGRDFWQFLLDSRIELRKIVWPTPQETGMTTLVGVRAS